MQSHACICTVDPINGESEVAKHRPRVDRTDVQQTYGMYCTRPAVPSATRSRIRHSVLRPAAASLVRRHTRNDSRLSLASKITSV